MLDDIQATPVSKPGIDEKWVTVPAEAGDVPVRIVRPPGSPGPLPVILYVHGGGWVLGNAAQWITRHGQSEGLDSSRIAVAGDSVGGNMAAVLAILAKQRGDVTFVHQSLYDPVTDAGQDTASYREFADGPYLRAASMAWFWDAYLPEADQRSDITASPLRATLGQLAGLPETFLIVDENDVLRDEGEAYGRKLTEAGVRTTIVRYDGTLHDFMMLNPLRGTAATTGAIEQAIHVLRQALGR